MGIFVTFTNTVVVDYKGGETQGRGGPQTS